MESSVGTNIEIARGGVKGLHCQPFTIQQQTFHTEDGRCEIRKYHGIVRWFILLVDDNTQDNPGTDYFKRSARFSACGI